MVVTTRLLKQASLFIIFLIIVGGGLVATGRALHDPTPTPTPDPRELLAPLIITDTYLFQVANNDYDFLAQVQNPNETYGAGSVTYRLSFFDEAGTPVSQKTNTFYILPGQTKFVIETPLRFASPISKAEMKITGVQWQELDPLALIGVDLVVTNEQFQKRTGPTIFGVVSGIVNNTSDFDVSSVQVVIVLLDAKDIPVAANRTEIRTFLADTRRGFESSWTAPLTVSVSKTYVEANTNLFLNDTFIRAHGGQEQFQTY